MVKEIRKKNKNGIFWITDNGFYMRVKESPKEICIRLVNSKQIKESLTTVLHKHPLFSYYHPPVL